MKKKHIIPILSVKILMILLLVNLYKSGDAQSSGSTGQTVAMQLLPVILISQFSKTEGNAVDKTDNKLNVSSNTSYTVNVQTVYTRDQIASPSKNDSTGSPIISLQQNGKAVNNVVYPPKTTNQLKKTSPTLTKNVIYTATHP